MHRLTIALALCLLAGPVHAGPFCEYKLDYSGAPDPMGADMYITFDNAVGATYTTEGGSYSMTVNGSPTRVNDGTGNQGALSC